MNQKGFKNVTVFFLVLVLAGAAGYFFYRHRSINVPQTPSGQGTIEQREVAKPDIKQFQRIDSVILKEAALDFDGDGQKEVAFLDEYYSHLIVLLKFNSTEQKWVKTILQEKNTSGYVKNSAALDIADLNHDNKEELFYRESVEGSGGIWLSNYFAWVDGKVKSIALPAGYPNIIGDFLVTTFDTRPDDRFAQPLPWEAHYYAFDGSRFLLRKIVKCFRNTVAEFNTCAKENVPTQ